MRRKSLKKWIAMTMVTTMVMPFFWNIDTYASDKVVDTFYVLDEEGNPVTVEVTEKDLEDASLEDRTYSVVASNADETAVMGEFETLEEAETSYQETIEFFESIGTYSADPDADSGIEVQIVDDKGDVAATTEDTIGIVRFNRENKTFKYIEVDSGREGYLSPNAAAEAAYIDTVVEDDVTKHICKIAGATIKVNAADAPFIMDYHDQDINYYYINEGRLIHRYYYYYGGELTTGDTRVGYKPAYLDAEKKYYSYDGHYFYESFEDMIDDYRNGTYAKSVNPSSPYYNYYQYLSMRTTALFTADQYDAYLERMKPGVQSVLKGAGNAFVNTQNSYTINSLLMYGISINETGWGTSPIAIEKNNVFGLDAVDSNAYEEADKYISVAACIEDFAYGWMQKGYLRGTDFRYRGPHLGDKHSGINVNYASDPFWGEKGASRGYYYDTDKVDYGRFTIGIAKSGIINLYKEPNASSTKIYTTSDSSDRNIWDFPVTILGKVTGSDGKTYYKVVSDMALCDDRSARDIEAQYMPQRDYVYAKASDIQVVFEGTGNKTSIPNPAPWTEEPDEDPDEEEVVVPEKTHAEVIAHLGVTNMDGYLTGFQMGGDVFAVIGKITALSDTIKVVAKDKNGTQVSSGMLTTGMTLQVTTDGSTVTYHVVIRGDVSGDGKISALDYVKVRNNLDGASNLTGAYAKAADASGDGKISALDYVKVRNHLDKKSTIAQ